MFREIVPTVRRGAAALPATTALVLALAAAACSRSSPAGPSVLPPSPPVPPGPVEPVPDPPRTRRTRYLAFGDSITSGTTSPAVRRLSAMSAGLPQSYPFKLQALLAARYSRQTIDVTNEGRHGELAGDGVGRFPGVLRAVSPEVVVLMHGVNDLSVVGLDRVPIIAGYVDSMAGQARVAGADVVICTYPPQRPGGFLATDPRVITAYNAAIRGIARGEGAILMDFEREVDVALMGVDGLHPTEEGFTRMADLLFAMLRSRYELP